MHRLEFFTVSLAHGVVQHVFEGRSALRGSCALSFLFGAELRALGLGEVLVPFNGKLDDIFAR